MPRDTEHVPQTDGIACLAGAAPEHGDLLIASRGASKHDSYARELDTMRGPNCSYLIIYFGYRMRFNEICKMKIYLYEKIFYRKKRK